MDEGGDLGAAVGGADVVPALAFGAEGDPVALAVGADPQAVGVLSIALAVALDDRADGLGPGAARQPSDPPVGSCMPPSDGWAA
jgi:hypothetical protein